MALNLSPTNYYELTNSYTGASFPLAVIPSSTDLELRVASKDDSSLSWQFLTAQDATKYNICTSYEGTSYCLDVLGNDKTTPHLATPAFVTGQQWTAIPGAGNTYKFSNDYSGSGYYLDIYSDTKQTLMSTGDHSGQYWTLNSEGEQPTPTSSTTMITVVKTTATSSSTTATTVDAESISTATGASGGTGSTSSSGSGGITKDGKLGMEVGLGIGIPAICVAILAWWFPCKSR